MKEKVIKKSLSVFLAMLFIIVSVPFTALADTTYHDVYLDSNYVSDYKYVQNYLDEARYNATDNMPYRIIFPSGTYSVTAQYHIYSNTYLKLNSDTRLVRTTASPFIRSGGKVADNESFKGYDGYKNITIDGGIWDGDYLTSANMRFAHANNLTFINMTLCNNKDSHLMECAAVDGFVIENCIFTGSKKTTSSSNEALQLDIIHSESHFPKFSSYDDTPCQNVRISSCKFSDVTAGIGTRSAVVGIYFNNINIVGNHFSGIKERAIVCFNYKNSNISGNTISSAAAGIEFKYMNGSSISKCFFMPNGKTPSSVNSNANTSINGNTINIKKTSTMSDACGIMIYGRKLSKTEEGIAKGDYTIKNINVYNNSITVSGNGKGMVINGTKNSKFSLNNVKLSGYSKGKNYNNISVNASSSVQFTNNTISGAAKHGFCIYKSSKNITLRDNNISNCYKYGIYVEKGSTIIEYPNKFKKCSSANMSINSKKVSNNTSKTKIKSVKKSKKSIKVTYNKVGGASSYKIYRSTNKNGNYSLIKTTSSTSFTDSKVESGTRYYYKVRTVKKSSSSSLLSGFSAVKSGVA